MEKTVIRITAIITGILAGIFALVGLINWALLPEQGNLIGCVFVVIAAAFLLMTFTTVRMARRLKDQSMDIIINGRKVEAKILEVKEISSITIDRRHPYVVICEAEGRCFESEYFYRDVHRFDERSSINVYLDEQTDEYYVDLES